MASESQRMESEQGQTKTTILTGAAQGENVAISTTTGEVFGERKSQIDHSYTEAVTELDNTKESPLTTEQREEESGNEIVNLSMDVLGEHDSKTESYKLIMCSDGIQRRGKCALFCHRLPHLK